MLSRKTRTKMQDLRRVSSWKPKKEKKSILARSKSEGEQALPQELRLPEPPMVPRHARPLPVTFHRAIDMTRDVFTALECVISLGCERVLTSGGESTVLEGLPVITRLIQQAEGRITVVPGGGITERNIERIMEQCKAKEFHASARSSLESAMSFRKTNISMGASFSPPEFSKKVTDTAKVKTFISLSSTKK